MKHSHRSHRHCIGRITDYGQCGPVPRREVRRSQCFELVATIWQTQVAAPIRAQDEVVKFASGEFLGLQAQLASQPRMPQPRARRTRSCVSSFGLGKIPVWVVRIRSRLCCIGQKHRLYAAVVPGSAVFRVPAANSSGRGRRTAAGTRSDHQFVTAVRSLRWIPIQRHLGAGGDFGYQNRFFAKALPEPDLK